MNLFDIIRADFSINKIYDELYEKDPNFRKFVSENKNKTIEQIAAEYRIDSSIFEKSKKL